MQINHNVRAMVTQHALFQNNSAMSKSLEKLSTGLRINRAQDDAAGLAMSEQMRTQIRGLGKAKQNSLDGIAALQIAEGGLAEITNLLQRQRELATQASNDTLTSTDRKYLDDEVQQLSQEIARIAASTDYNGKNLLVGTVGSGGNKASADNSFGVKRGDASSNPMSWTLHVGANYKTNLGGAQSNSVLVSYSAIGVLSGDGKSITIGSVNFGGTSSGIKVTSQTLATATMDNIDKVIKSISGARASIGTFINRLEYTVNNIANMEYNTQDAESRIRDTDFAKETTNFTRNQIMVQSATSMLAQANSLPQSVLGLLG
ncbi:MAG: flagellin [Fibromonadales bacterium]|nr:flagellin [Fibromonadales bacterium]